MNILHAQPTAEAQERVLSIFAALASDPDAADSIANSVRAESDIVRNMIELTW